MNLVEDVLIVPVINLSVALSARAACGRWNGNTGMIHSLAVSWLHVTLKVAWSCENKQDGSSSCRMFTWPSFYCCSGPLKTKACTSSSVNDNAGADLVWTMAGLNRAWTPLQASTVTSQCFTWGGKKILFTNWTNVQLHFLFIRESSRVNSLWLTANSTKRVRTPVFISPMLGFCSYR